MSKLLFLDVETSSLDSVNGAILQIACIIEVNGKTVGEFSSYVKPHKKATIDKEALKINGLRKKKIKKFKPSTQVFDDFIIFLDKYVNKYDKKDKYLMVAYNGNFDKNFIFAWANRVGFHFLGSYIDHRLIDPLILARTAHYLGQLPNQPEDFKLSTMCGVYGINTPNHDAVEDIVATKKLFEAIIKGWK